MALTDDISQQMKDAMRAKDALRLATLRAMRTAFLNAMKIDGADSLADDKAIALLRKLAKQRQDSMTAYKDAGRDDLYAQEEAELAIIDEFLPSLADADTTRAWVAQAIAETGAESPRDMGKVMGAVMKAHKGDVDGNLVRQLAQELLAG